MVGFMEGLLIRAIHFIGWLLQVHFLDPLSISLRKG